MNKNLIMKKRMSYWIKMRWLRERMIMIRTRVFSSYQ